jgi:hypothetical protein
MKEDSLVNENMKLIEQEKIDAAISYMNNVLVKRGVSQENISMVDKAILGRVGSYSAGVEASVSREIQDFESTSSESVGLGFADIQARMKEKTDSIRAHKEEQARLARIEYERTHKKEIEEKKRREKELQKNKAMARQYSGKIYELLEANKAKKAYSKFLKYKKPLKKHLPKEVYACLEDIVVQANQPKKVKNTEDKKNKEKAKQAAREIYTLLEQNKADKAYTKFQNMRTFIKKNSLREDYSNLETYVLQAYKSSQKEKQEIVVARKKVETPKKVVAPRKVETRKKVETPRKVETPKKVETTTIPEPISNNVAGNIDAYAEFDKVKEGAKDKATQDVQKIYSLIEGNQIKQAYEYFKKNQILIKKYVIKEVYDVLEATVTDAYK